MYITYCKGTKALVEYVYVSKMACNCRVGVLSRFVWKIGRVMSAPSLHRVFQLSDMYFTCTANAASYWLGYCFRLINEKLEVQKQKEQLAKFQKGTTNSVSDC